MRFLLIAWIIVAADSSVLLAQESPNESPKATSTEARPAFLRPHPPRKPIPLQWKIAIVLGGLTISAALLTIAARSWHTWNLFDRQYQIGRAHV